MEESIYELRGEIAALRAMINGDYHDANWWLATKVDRQRKALDAIQRKGPGHTKEEREELALVNA